MAKKDILLKEGLTIFMLAVVVILVGMVFYLYGAQNNVTGEAARSLECSDNVDNDGDGYCDFGLRAKCTDGSVPGDPGCLSKRDGTECTPTIEICDGIDNDCDGLIDEGAAQSCYNGPVGTEGIGACKAGTQTCSGGVWGFCTGEVTPSPEICGDGKDNDCNNQVDEGCVAQYSCADTDGGNVPDVKGTVSGYYNYLPYSYTDYCMGTNATVKEYYCRADNKPETTYTYNCITSGNSTGGNYRGCANGACY